MKALVSILKIPRKGLVVDHSAAFQFGSHLLSSSFANAVFTIWQSGITALGWIQTVLKAKRAALPEGNTARFGRFAPYFIATRVSLVYSSIPRRVRARRRGAAFLHAGQGEIALSVLAAGASAPVGTIQS